MQMYKHLNEYEQFAEPRLAFSFLIDTSGSMGSSAKNTPIQFVNEFLNSISNRFDDSQYACIDFSVISFSHTAELVSEYKSIQDRLEIHLDAEGPTAMGEAINLSYDLLSRQLRDYREKGIRYFKPIIFMLTDGGATDDMTLAFKKIEDGNHRMTRFVSAGVMGYDENLLSRLSSTSFFVDMDNADLTESLEWIFKWLINEALDCRAQIYPQKSPTSYEVPLGVHFICDR